MNNNIYLTITSDSRVFQATLEKVDNRSSETITINGKHYRISDDDIKVRDYKNLAKRLQGISWIKFSSINDFKEKFNENIDYSILEHFFSLENNAAELSHLKEIGLQTLLQKRKLIVEEALQPMVQDRVQLREIRRQAQEALSTNQSPTEISHQLCEGIKSLMKRMYDEGVEHLKQQGLEPPCKYCVVGLGSIARDEAGPYPDFDNIIVVERKTPEVEQYFLRLNQYVADRVYRLGESLEGNKPGLRFCWGNLNPPHQPYETRYSATPTYRGRADLLVEPIQGPTTVKLGDIRDGVPFCGSDLSLYDTYKKTVFPTNVGRQQVYANMERQANGLRSSESNPPAPITASKLPALVHVKEDLCRLPAAAIGALSLYHGIDASTTLGRIEALKTQGHLDPDLATRLETVMVLLIKWRIQVQSAHGQEFEFIASSSKALTTFENELPERIHNLKSKIAQLDAAPVREESAINNAKGQLEFLQDCRNWILDAVKAKTTAFSESDQTALHDVVLPTLRELYERVDRCLLPGSQEIDSSVFQ